MPTPSESRSDLPRMFEQLERVGDELRLQLHLAGMDARKEWSSIERELHQVKDRFSPSAPRPNGTRLRRAIAVGLAVRRFVVEHLRAPLRRRRPALKHLPYGYVAELRGLSLKTAVTRIARELEREGFVVTTELAAPSRAKLGRGARAYRVLGASALDLTARVLERDPHGDLLTTYPIIVRERGPGVEVSALSPETTLACSEADLMDIADEADHRLVRALEAVARH